MGNLAPTFSLYDQDGILRHLEDYRGRWIVLYFYPWDSSPGCTEQACEFRDEYRIITQFGNAEIIGINKGTVKSHKRFSDHNHLQFPLLSDPAHKVTEAYGAWRTNVAQHAPDKPFGTRRNTYIVNAAGIIVKQYLGINPRGNAEQIIEDLHALRAVPKTLPTPA
jgi:peroxiredoxin Q/BCP